MRMLKGLVLLGLGLAIVYQGYVLLNQKRTPLPDITIQTIDQLTQNLQTIGKEQNTLVILFSTTCEFCKKEFQGIHAALDDFQDIALVMLAKEPYGNVKIFKEDYFPDNRPNVTFGSINAEDMNLLAEEDLAFPYLIWFDAYGQVRARHKGLVSAQQILEVING